MTDLLENEADYLKAIITRVSRRKVRAYSEQKKHEVEISTLAKFVDMVVGDRVKIHQSKGEFQISEILERSSVFYRSFESKTKLIAANVDHVYIISAPPPLLNLTWIDRAITAALSHEIACSLIINKIDLISTTEIQFLINYYEGMGVKVHCTSVKLGHGLALLEQELFTSDNSVTLFTGVSGVGKSSLLNVFIPDAQRVVGDISEKTGQGKQTTSLAHAFPLHKKDAVIPLGFIVDAPGLQNFGLSHLSQREALRGFPDFEKEAKTCKFSTCSHSHEQQCGVISAVESGIILPSRYISYRNILDEIIKVESNKYR